MTGIFIKDEPGKFLLQKKTAKQGYGGLSYKPLTKNYNNSLARLASSDLSPFSSFICAKSGFPFSRSIK